MKMVYFLFGTVFVVGMTIAAWHSYDGMHIDTLDRAWWTLKWFVVFAAFAGLTAIVVSFLDKRRTF